MQKLQFGYDPADQIRDDRRTVYDPDLRYLTIPLPELGEIVIYADTCRKEQIQSLVRYPKQVHGEIFLKNNVTLTLYGSLQESEESLIRNWAVCAENLLKYE